MNKKNEMPRIAKSKNIVLTIMAAALILVLSCGKNNKTSLDKNPNKKRVTEDMRWIDTIAVKPSNDKTEQVYYTLNQIIEPNALEEIKKYIETYWDAPIYARELWAVSLYLKGTNILIKFWNQDSYYEIDDEGNLLWSYISDEIKKKLHGQTDIKYIIDIIKIYIRLK